MGQLETAILWATGRLLRRGVANGEIEFEGVLKLYTSPEEHNVIFQSWISACRKARTKAEETGNAEKAQQCVDAERSVLRRAAELIGASATEKLTQGQESSQAPSQQRSIGSGGVPPASGTAASKNLARVADNKRPKDPATDDATVTSCAAAPPDKRARLDKPATESRVEQSQVEPSGGLPDCQTAHTVDSAAGAAHARPHLAPSEDRIKVAPPRLPPPAQEVSQASQWSAGVRDTQHSAQSASAYVSNGPPSIAHGTGTGSVSVDRGDARRPAHVDPAPTPSARVTAHSMPKTEQPASALGAQAALPSVPSTHGHTRPGSTVSGDGTRRPSSAREDGTERSASLQTARQGKSARVPLQERPRADAGAVRQQKVVTFQEPQSSRDVEHSSQRLQHSQPAVRASPAASKVTLKEHSNADGARKESSFTGWDIADPNLSRPENYKPVKAPKEGDILFVKEAPFKIMYKVGSGASSKVYKVLGPNLRLFALKVVSWKGSNSKEMVRGFKEEFAKLKSLRDSPGVINVYDLEEFPEEKMLLMCLQLGDIDLAKLLKNKRAEWAVKGITDPFVADPTFICALWHDMLRAVQSIHQHKMVHADLKPANLVIVDGSIKIIDFGISMQCGANTTAIHRDDNTGTVNYMSPEAIANNERVGRNSDVWSLGCILYEIAYGHLPFGHITSLPSKVDAIVRGEVEYPPISQGDVLHVLKRCLVRNPDKRADIDELLQHQYVSTVAGGVITQQTMWNTMMGFRNVFKIPFTEEEANDICRLQQEACNSGKAVSAEALIAKAWQRKQAAQPQLAAPAEQRAQESAVLQQQQPNRIQSAHADVQQQKSAVPEKGAMQAPAAKAARGENAGDLLEARLMAIRRAHEEADDGNTKTRL